MPCVFRLCYMSWHRTYHALYSTVLPIQTNLMCTISCMLNHILITTHTRFGIHWCHCQGFQSYCSSFSTHQNCDFIQATLRWLTALITHLLHGRNLKLSDERWMNCCSQDNQRYLMLSECTSWSVHICISSEVSPNQILSALQCLYARSLANTKFVEYYFMSCQNIGFN